MSRLVVVAVVVLALAGTAVAASSPLPRKPPHPDTVECGAGVVHSRALWFHAADGVVLAAAEYGKGARGVVLAPESGGSHCGWLPFAKVLAARGYHVLAYDLRERGQSPSLTRNQLIHYDADVVGAAQKLHALGASKVVVAGASLGGASVLAAGPELNKLASGIVDFSGEPSLASADEAVPKITLPILVVGSKNDYYAPAATSHWVMAHTGSEDKQLLLEPGAAHGWDIVQVTPYSAKARATVLAWLARHTN